MFGVSHQILAAEGSYRHRRDGLEAERPVEWRPLSPSMSRHASDSGVVPMGAQDDGQVGRTFKLCCVHMYEA